MNIGDNDTFLLSSAQQKQLVHYFLPFCQVNLQLIVSYIPLLILFLLTFKLPQLTHSLTFLPFSLTSFHIVHSSGCKLYRVGRKTSQNKMTIDVTLKERYAQFKQIKDDCFSASQKFKEAQCYFVVDTTHNLTLVHSETLNFYFT